ncbi:phosphotransferase family protein [Paenibacillus tarimensis]|uniref:phosphotransferase family protein n=1 Tax=Paenibacillus tarimensis TaxID=416012 RepID=UPI001F427AF9|nr:aminoglycoside phosphotransferase family protein [Paenibacillus tarimensis]MCF2946072.1 aminoglycoside phosphotransferase family protein [Paenibacillus tarimensis]
MNKEDIIKLIGERSLFSAEADIQPVYRGMSGDGKFLVTECAGKDLANRYLLRTFPTDLEERKQIEFDLMAKLHSSGIRCAKPLATGRLTSELGYTIVSYIEGQEAAEVITGLTQREQYQIGLDAGTELGKIHDFAAPALAESWCERKTAKHRRYIEAYTKQSVRIPHDDKVMSFIEQNLPLMQGRPDCLQHDDYHLANLVIRDGKLAGVIDFERYDWGDPVHDFLKLGMFCTELSMPYSIGQIDGYHRQQPPTELFWRLYALYIAMCLFSSVVWTLQVQPDNMNAMMLKINRVLDDHDNFERIKPAWYPST